MVFSCKEAQQSSLENAVDMEKEEVSVATSKVWQAREDGSAGSPFHTDRRSSTTSGFTSAQFLKFPDISGNQSPFLFSRPTFDLFFSLLCLTSSRMLFGIDKLDRTVPLGVRTVFCFVSGYAFLQIPGDPHVEKGFVT